MRTTRGSNARLAAALLLCATGVWLTGCAGGGAAVPGPAADNGSRPAVAPSARDDAGSEVPLPSGARFVTSFGGTGERIGQFRAPEAIAVDLKGNVFVAERLNNRVQKFDRDGQYILQFGSLGSGPGQFNYPISLFAQQGLWLYVLDAQNERLVKYDLNGNVSGTVLDLDGQRVRSQVGVVRPRAVTVDRDGNIYIAEREHNRVLMFNNFLDYRLSLGGSGTGEAALLDPRGVVVGENGDIIVADNGNGRLAVFSSLGVMQRTLKLEASGPAVAPRGMVRDASGMLFVADPPGNRVLAIAPDGSVAFTVEGDAADTRMDDPTDVALDARGRLFITDTGHDRVVVYDLVRGR